MHPMNFFRIGWCIWAPILLGVPIALLGGMFARLSAALIWLGKKCDQAADKMAEALDWLVNSVSSD